MRNTFIEKLVQLAEKDDKIALIIGDLGYNVVEPFQEKFPERFLNAGICEQSMASMAAGMAHQGYQVFIYSIANFPTFRCAEQIRNDICYHNLPVTIVSVGGGLAYGNLGYSHHAVQDYGLMRLFPELSIVAPGDPNEVKTSMDFIHDSKFPTYLRLRKAGENNYTHQNKLRPGIWNEIVPSENGKILLSTGYGLELGMRMLNDNKYMGYGLYTCPIWGTKEKHFQNEQFANFKKVISIEDHLLESGFGSWLRESLNKYENQKLVIKALNQNIIGKVGKEEFLLKLGGFG